jgi:hypothetical protein
MTLTRLPADIPLAAARTTPNVDEMLPCPAYLIRTKARRSIRDAFATEDQSIGVYINEFMPSYASTLSADGPIATGSN